MSPRIQGIILIFIYVGAFVVFMTYGMTGILAIPIIIITGIISFFIRCPLCGKPVFVRQQRGLRYILPWPEQRCSRCGADLTATTHVGQPKS